MHSHDACILTRHVSLMYLPGQRGVQSSNTSVLDGQASQQTGRLACMTVGATFISPVCASMLSYLLSGIAPASPAWLVLRVCNCTATVLRCTVLCCTVVMARFARTAIKMGKLRLILPNGEERLYGGDDSSCAPPMAAGEEWRGLPPRRATVRVINMDVFKKVCHGSTAQG